MIVENYGFVYFCVPFGIDDNPKQFKTPTIAVNELDSEISNAINIILIGIRQLTQT